MLTFVVLNTKKGVETHRKQGAFFVPTHIKFSGITPRAIAVIAWRSPVVDLAAGKRSTAVFYSSNKS